jgi:hypothetical protein
MVTISEWSEPDSEWWVVNKERGWCQIWHGQREDSDGMTKFCFTTVSVGQSSNPVLHTKGIAHDVVFAAGGLSTIVNAKQWDMQRGHGRFEFLSLDSLDTLRFIILTAMPSRIDDVGFVTCIFSVQWLFWALLHNGYEISSHTWMQLGQVFNNIVAKSKCECVDWSNWFWLLAQIGYWRLIRLFAAVPCRWTQVQVGSTEMSKSWHNDRELMVAKHWVWGLK